MKYSEGGGWLPETEGSTSEDCGPCQCKDSAAGLKAVAPAVGVVAATAAPRTERAFD